MSVRDYLALDHFYIAFPPEEFEKLLPLTSILRNCFHFKVKSGNDSWEGIYMQNRTGSYWEIVKDSKVNGFGAAFSAFALPGVDVRQIIKEMPALAWKKGTRLTPEGVPWFDWLSLGEYLDIYKTFFNVWIMHYHTQLKRPFNPPDSNINRFSKIHLTLGQAHKKIVKALSEWLPGTRFINEKQVKFVVPNRDRNDFEILIELIPGDGRFEFKSLDAVLPQGVIIKDHDLGALSLWQEGRTFYFKLAKESKLEKNFISEKIKR